MIIAHRAIVFALLAATLPCAIARAAGDGATPCDGGDNVLALRLAVFDSLCLNPGDVITYSLEMSCMIDPAAGYQAFIEYDPSLLDFIGGAYVTPDPFGLPLLLPIVAVDGSIDLAAGINVFVGQQPTTEDATLATLTFQARVVDAQADLRFRPHNPPSRFTSLSGAAISTTVRNSTVIRISDACLHPCSPGVGDVNGDLSVDLADVAPAVDVLLGLDTEPGHVAAVDANCDGLADGADIQPFVDYLLSFN